MPPRAVRQALVFKVNHYLLWQTVAPKESHTAEHWNDAHARQSTQTKRQKRVCFRKSNLPRLAGTRPEIGFDVLRIDWCDFDQLDERLAAVVQSQQILPCDLQ